MGLSERETFPRRILLGLGTSGPGGAEQLILQLATALRERGASPVLATLQPGWMTERAQLGGFPVWIEPQRRGPDPGWVLRLARRLRRENIDLLHSHEFEMNAYGGAAAVLARVPNVATLHGSVWGVEHFRHLLAYRALRRAGQRVVAVSHDLARLLAPRLRTPLEAIQVVHNGIPIPRAPSPSSRAARRTKAREELGIGSQGPLLVAIGNLYPVKDHASLIRAVAMLPGVQLAIAGRGQEEDALRRLSTELGTADRVHLLGLRDDVERILEAADVFVQPSRSEGLPLSILEAMAAELPIVATRVGGVGEAILNGQTGHLIEPGEPAALADALRKILESPDRGAALAAAARRRAKESFSVERMADEYVGLYRKLLRS